MIDIAKIVELSEEIVLDETELSGTTCFGIAKVINATLAAMDYSGLPVQPQQIYNANKNGTINGTKKAMRYTDDEVMTYVAKFVRKLTSK